MLTSNSGGSGSSGGGDGGSGGSGSSVQRSFSVVEVVVVAMVVLVEVVVEASVDVVGAVEVLQFDRQRRESFENPSCFSERFSNSIVCHGRNRCRLSTLPQAPRVPVRVRVRVRVRGVLIVGQVLEFFARRQGLCAPLCSLRGRQSWHGFPSMGAKTLTLRCTSPCQSFATTWLRFASLLPSPTRGATADNAQGALGRLGTKLSIGSKVSRLR